ncbi:Ribosomal L1 domain-containing protein [Toxocara canis]|uniref:Ribosomal L1 domain-containing protein n=1 Tax=Toxocara canis TaxID=6265 RepID=A0A0B2V4A6_TOXCA|nr:Ribosomal L1 domain-containing protein [Toxocara canis]
MCGLREASNFILSEPVSVMAKKRVMHKQVFEDEQLSPKLKKRHVDKADKKSEKSAQKKMRMKHALRKGDKSTMGLQRRPDEHEEDTQATDSVADRGEQSIDEAKDMRVEDKEGVVHRASPASTTSENKLHAISAVRKHAEQAITILRELSLHSKNKALFPEIDQAIHIQCVYKKPAVTNSKPLWHKQIVLPHALHNEQNTTVCLIMADMDRSKKALFDPDVDKQSRKWEDIMRDDYGITKSQVHKILTVRQLEREYHTYFEKRQLASAYDIFVVDSRVARSVWRECGKEFHRVRKMPFSVNVSKKTLLQQIKRTYSTVTLPLSPRRTRTSLVVGNLSQTTNNLVDNIVDAVKGLFDFCPGGITNVRSIYVQIVSGGPTIPIYADVGSANEVRLPLPMKKKDSREYKETAGELSTLPDGLEVVVRADGKVRVIDSQTKKSVYYPTVNDEWEEGDDLKPRVDPAKMLDESSAGSHWSSASLSLLEFGVCHVIDQVADRSEAC